MCDAGYVCGYDDQFFKPNLPLTREQMIAIKIPVDYGTGKPKYAGVWDAWHFADDKQIAPRYHQSILADHGSYTDTNARSNITRCFGKTEIFHPQKPVTRGEAAVCLSVFGVAS
jgi:hypothetical protein